MVGVFKDGKRVIAQPPAEWLDELKRALTYNPDTGEFIRRETRSKFLAGTVAGHLDASTGYVRLDIRQRRAWAHQVAWYYITGAWPTLEIDHKNGIRHDNRATNLREATHVQNHYNRHSVSGSSRYLGVTPSTREGRWIAHARPRGYLGYFFSEEEAARAYDRACLARDPEFARTNFPRTDYEPSANPSTQGEG